MKNCPICNNPFIDFLELKTKPDIYLCNKHGLFYIENNSYKPVSYPCPECQSNYKIPLYHKDTWAICKCEIHGIWKVSFLRSFKFRKLCSIVASKPNRDPEYYTPPELRVKRILDDLNIRYEHNKPIKNNKSVYYPDFIIERPTKIVIGVDPSIWHTRWNREKSDREKRLYFISKGYKYVSLTDKNRKEWPNLIKEALGV